MILPFGMSSSRPASNDDYSRIGSSERARQQSYREVIRCLHNCRSLSPPIYSSSHERIESSHRDDQAERDDPRTLNYDPEVTVANGLVETKDPRSSGIPRQGPILPRRLARPYKDNPPLYVGSPTSASFRSGLAAAELP